MYVFKAHSIKSLVDFIASGIPEGRPSSNGILAVIEYYTEYHVIRLSAHIVAVRKVHISSDLPYLENLHKLKLPLISLLQHHEPLYIRFGDKMIRWQIANT